MLALKRRSPTVGPCDRSQYNGTLALLSNYPRVLFAARKMVTLTIDATRDQHYRLQVQR